MIFKPRRVIQSNQRRSNSEQRQRANVQTATPIPVYRPTPINNNTLFKGKATISQGQLPRNITAPTQGVQNDLYAQLNE